MARPSGRRRRSLAVVLAAGLAAPLVPLAAGSAAAVGGYVLAGPSVVTVGTTVTYHLSNPSLGPAGLEGGYYCVAASPGDFGTVGTMTGVDDGDLSADLPVRFTASGFYTIGAFELPLGAMSCPPTTAGQTVLATESVSVADAAASVNLDPASGSANAGSPVSFAATYLDGFNLPTALASNQTVVITAPSSTTTTFNGPSATSLTLTPSSSRSFTAQNTQANQNVVIRAQLLTGAVVTSTATAVLSTQPSGRLTVSPTTASTVLGGTTTLTATFTNGSGQPAGGVAVTVASSGRNAYASKPAGTTNSAGQVVYQQVDSAPSSSTAMQDVVTFSALGQTATSTITYATPAPGAPANVVAVAGNSSATVSWTAPTGVSVTSYAVQQSVNGGASWDTSAGSPTTATSLVVTGLDNGVAVVFRVSATGPSGTGPWSASSAPVTPVAPVEEPSEVTDLKATSKNRGKATVSWGPPDSGPVSGYAYRLKKGNGSFSAWKSLSPSTKKLQLSNLTPGKQYTIQVRASNVAGNGPASAVKVTIKR